MADDVQDPPEAAAGASLPPLATAADLQALKVDVSDLEAVAVTLDAVSSAIRAAAGVPINLATSTVRFWTEPARRLELPARPVRQVHAVKLDGVEITDWKLRGSSLWRSVAWHQRGAVPSEVEVTFTHGYDPVPADIVRLTCVLAAAGLAEVTDGLGETRGLSYTKIDDFSEGYTAGENEVVDKTSIPAETRAMLRRRFGTGSTVMDSVR